MEVVILGAHGTWPSAGGATSGLLLRQDGFSLWMDAGTGTLANLQQHIGLFDVDAMVISHSHPDHVTDLYAYYFARMFSPEHPPNIPLLVAPKVMDRVNPLLTDDQADLRVAECFDVVEVQPGEEHRIGPFRMVTAPMRHTVPTIGVRMEADGFAMAYSADTGPTEELVGLARGADLLIAEASYQERSGTELPPIHLTAKQGGEAATEAGAERLMLTHIRPYLDRTRSREEASTSFDGEILMAEEHQVVKVG
ncbi:MAG TPA: MBL fold metallo-hydrolase [Actinomycetota bacterium]|nr:MBL fold metallo-hydrolase [Actinomycetota bacterium]